MQSEVKVICADKEADESRIACVKLTGTYEVVE